MELHWCGVRTEKGLATIAFDIRCEFDAIMHGPANRHGKKTARNVISSHATRVRRSISIPMQHAVPSSFTTSRTIFAFHVCSSVRVCRPPTRDTLDKSHDQPRSTRIDGRAGFVCVCVFAWFCFGFARNNNNFPRENGNFRVGFRNGKHARDKHTHTRPPFFLR